MSMPNVFLRRIATYNGKTTAIVVWQVIKDNRIMIECDRKKDALKWLDIYTD